MSVGSRVFKQSLLFLLCIIFTGCGAGALGALTETDGKLYVKRDTCADHRPPKSELRLVDLLNQQKAGRDASETGIMLLEDGGGALAARGWLSREALRSIDVQYFIFSADQLGLIALQELINSARRGVKVRLLVDDLLHDGEAQILLAAAQVENLEIRIYNPSINIGKSFPSKIASITTDFRGANQRMHNKTFIVDDEVVITGGRNIADEYFDFSPEYNFRDRDILLLGGISSDVKSSFDLFWNHSLSVPLISLLEPQSQKDRELILRQMARLSCDPTRFWPAVQERIANVPKRYLELIGQGHFVWVNQARFVSDDPGKNKTKKGLKGGGVSTTALIELIEQAKESIVIQTPYLVTTQLGKGLFERAIKRGVKVKIITNSLASTDSFPAFASYRSDRDELVRIGVELYESRPSGEAWLELMTSALMSQLKPKDAVPPIGLHAKSMVIDQHILIVGTFNLDPRSANLNTECIVIVDHQGLASQMQNQIEREMSPQNAWKITESWNPDYHASWRNRWLAFWSWFVPKSII